VDEAEGRRMPRSSASWSWPLAIAGAGQGSSAPSIEMVEVAIFRRSSVTVNATSCKVHVRMSKETSRIRDTGDSWPTKSIRTPPCR
jgi:hypothetical protein